MKIHMMLFGLCVSGFLLISNGLCEAPAGPSEAADTAAKMAPAAVEKGRQSAPEQAEPDAGSRANGPPAGSGEKAGAEKTSSETKPPAMERRLDRRWILKMESTPIPPAKKKELAWTGKDQQQKCETLRRQLLEDFRKVKHYSINGDGCNTAGYSRRFLSVKDECERECPAGFLENYGYNETLVRNIGTLLELGTKRCLGDRANQKETDKKREK